MPPAPSERPCCRPSRRLAVGSAVRRQMQPQARVHQKGACCCAGQLADWWSSACTARPARTQPSTTVPSNFVCGSPGAGACSHSNCVCELRDTPANVRQRARSTPAPPPTMQESAPVSVEQEHDALGRAAGLLIAKGRQAQPLRVRKDARTELDVVRRGRHGRRRVHLAPCFANDKMC